MFFVQKLMNFHVYRILIVCINIRKFKTAENPWRFRKIKVFKISAQVNRFFVVENTCINKIVFNHRRNKIKLFMKFHVCAELALFFLKKVHCAADSFDYNIAVYRLCYIFVGTKFNSSLRILKTVKSTKNYKNNIRLELCDYAYSFESAKARHVDIYKKNINIFFHYNFNCFCSRKGSEHFCFIGKVLAYNV